MSPNGSTDHKGHYLRMTEVTEPGLKSSGGDRQDSLGKTVQELATKFMHGKPPMALSVGVFKNGTSYLFNLGTTERSPSTPPASGTIYEIGSVTKTFTGILLAHALLEKKISLDDDARKYFPGALENLIFDGVPVTIRNLANHTAGLPKFIPAFSKDLTPTQIMSKYGHLSENEFLSMTGKVKLEAHPGTSFNYSNAGTELLGIILERVYHNSYGDLLKKYITRQQHMDDTKLSLNQADESRFPNGYNDKGQPMLRLSFNFGNYSGPFCGLW